MCKLIKVVVEPVICEIVAECEFVARTEAREVMKVVAETGICEEIFEPACLILSMLIMHV